MRVLFTVAAIWMLMAAVAFGGTAPAAARQEPEVYSYRQIHGQTLNVYDGVGHLLTRNLANQESDFDPDPDARADGIAQHVRFLNTLQFIPRR